MKRRNLLKLLLSTALLLAVTGCGAGSAGSAIPGAAKPAGQGQTATVKVPADREHTDAGLVVHFIDVGQGDSILAESGGRYLLVDAGENDQVDTVVTYLNEQGVKTLDYVIGTHPHSDHIGGLDGVIEAFDVKKVIMPPVEHTTKTFEDVLDAVADKGLKLTKPRVGDTYPLGDASFTIIAPNGDYGDDLNNWSVGIRLDYGENRFVMCGDAETPAEADILNNGIDLSSSVLKAGHHGSSTSTSDAFLDRVNPATVVIQCGKGNSYGHPHKETLEKLKKRGIHVYRTDLDGSITAACDGTTITWGTEKAGTLWQGGNGAAGQTGSGQTGSGQTGADNRADAATETTYILNTNTKKFHYPDCPSAGNMSEKNRKTWEGSREELIEQGYSPCGQCKP